MFIRKYSLKIKCVALFNRRTWFYFVIDGYYECSHFHYVFFILFYWMDILDALLTVKPARLILY